MLQHDLGPLDGLISRVQKADEHFTVHCSRYLGSELQLNAEDQLGELLRIPVVVSGARLEGMS